MGLHVGALDDGSRTIPYGGYVDFDGEPVNAGSVEFNFVLFPCATPGTGAGGCSALWVAKGAWTDTATWTTGWPTGASDAIDLPIFSGRFTVELGGAGQNPLPDAVFAPDDATLYLGVRVEGRALGSLQKLVPSARARVAQHARLADVAGDFTVTGDLVMDGGVASGLRLEHLAAEPVACTETNVGQVYFDTGRDMLRVCDGDAWADVNSKRRRSTSCRDLLAQGYSTDGLYTITPKVGGPEVEVYCDMTTDGGGWTLVSYSYRATLGTSSDPYLIPNSLSPDWDAGPRGNIAAIDASDLLLNGHAMAITTTTGGAAVTGNIKAYTTAHAWEIQNPASVNSSLVDQPNCVQIWVRDIHLAGSFQAFQQSGRLTVSCTGNKGGTPYERTMIGFNTAGCYGICGNDHADSMGMTVWYGSGYCPTTSGGNGCPERAGSIALWVK